MNQKQRERWAKSRAGGERRFILRHVVTFALCAAAGHILWGLFSLLWREDAAPRFVRDPGSVAASVAAVATASYFYFGREWRKNEREYLAAAEAESPDNRVA